MKFVALVLATSLVSAAMPAAVHAKTVKAPAAIAVIQTCSSANLTTSTDCQIVPGNNDSASDMNGFNAGSGVFGINTWLLADKSDDGALISPYDLTITNPGTKSGAWSVTSFGGYESAAIVLKGGSVAWIAYLLDISKLSGLWSTADLLNAGGNQPNLSHMSLYVGGKSRPDVPAPVPVPAAGLLLLGALGGLSMLRRAKAA